MCALTFRSGDFHLGGTQCVVSTGDIELIGEDVLSNAGKEFSAESIMEYYEKKNHRSVGQRTVYNYIEKMQRAFLVHATQKYDIVGKTALPAKQKYYAVDTGFRTIHTNTIALHLCTL